MRSHRMLKYALCLSVLYLLGGSAPAQNDRGGGVIMPGSARPLGYLLTKAAQATAAFALGSHAPDTYPDAPFQILYTDPTVNPFENTIHVKPGTFLYTTVVSADDSPPIIGDFPADITDHNADVDYLVMQTPIRSRAAPRTALLCALVIRARPAQGSEPSRNS